MSPQVGGRRWQTRTRAGLLQRQAGRRGSKASGWRGPRDPATSLVRAMRDLSRRRPELSARVLTGEVWDQPA